MQFQYTFVFALLTFSSALPTLKSARQLIGDISPTIAPSIDLSTLNDLCAGIAVCNPVTVNSNNNNEGTQGNGKQQSEKKSTGKFLGIL